MSDAFQDLGMFPLRLFLLPGEQTTLHVFEPRYLQLVTECYNEERYFGIPYQTKTKLSEYGSKVKVVQILKTYESGELDIMVECVENFQTKQYQGKAETKLYPHGLILPLANTFLDPNPSLINIIRIYLESILDKSISDEIEEYFQIKQIIKALNLTDEEKFKLFNYPPDKRNDYLESKAKFLTILVEQEKKVVDQFYLN